MESQEYDKDDYIVDFIDDDQELDRVFLEDDSLRKVYEEFINGYESDRF